MKKIGLLICMIGFGGFVFAQKIKYTADFLQKLDATEIDIYKPLEGKYKSKRPLKNDYLAIDHIIFSKKEDLEIRYVIIPFDSDDLTTQAPHVDFMRVVTTTTTNEDEGGTVTVHNVEKEMLKEKFNADWGCMAYYQPKSKFANFEHCRLLSLYKEGKGMVYIFFLFDEPSRFLDNRLNALRFRTNL